MLAATGLPAHGARRHVERRHAGGRRTGGGRHAQDRRLVAAGLTVGCAQCHDHRYDPIPQTDYYRLRAVFEPALDPGHWRRPAQRLVSLYTDADRARAAAIEAEAATLQTAHNQKQATAVAGRVREGAGEIPRRRAAQAQRRVRDAGGQADAPSRRSSSPRIPS